LSFSFLVSSGAGIAALKRVTKHINSNKKNPMGNNRRFTGKKNMFRTDIAFMINIIYRKVKISICISFFGFLTGHGGHGEEKKGRSPSTKNE